MTSHEIETRYVRYALLTLLMILCIRAIPSRAQPASPDDGILRSITPITDSLYRYQYQMHVSVFLVTPDGILITDPTTVDSARWLQAELKKRFNRPVRYMVYSHHHSDHIGGAGVFDVPGVTILAHELTKKALIEHPLPGARIPLPTQTFSEPMTLKFGGKTIRLFRLEPTSHADDLIAMHFVEDRTLFVVDLISVKGIGFLNFSNVSFPQMIDTIRGLQRIDYEHLVDSHGPLGTKEDGDVFLHYLEDLRAAVQKAIDSGESLDSAQRTIHLEQYKSLALYDQWLGSNIEGAYGALKMPTVGGARSIVSDTARADSRIQSLAVFCSACHGPKGISAGGKFPNLAGQKYEYLLKALRAYQQQERYDPYMSQLEFLTEDELDGIARYYSRLGPST